VCVHVIKEQVGVGNCGTVNIAVLIFRFLV